MSTPRSVTASEPVQAQREATARQAAELAALDELAAKVAAQLPPMTHEQRLRVRQILHGR